MMQHQLNQVSDPITAQLQMQIAHARRLVALQSAHNADDAPEVVVERAKKYHSFLSGDDA